MISSRLPSSRSRSFAAIVAISALVALLAAVANAGFVPVPGQDPDKLHVAVAKTHMLVDSPGLPVLERQVLRQDLQTLVKHGAMLSGVMVTDAVLDRISQRAGLPAGRITASARTTDQILQVLTEPDSLRRAADIAEKASPYRFEVQARSDTPVVDIYALAPSPAEAARLADATILGLQDYLQALAGEQDFPESELVHLRPLGAATGHTVQSRGPQIIAILTFVTVFSVTAAALWVLLLWRRHGRWALRSARRPEPDLGGNWPHTTRILPWTIALFLALLWLVPFNQIELNVPAPIDLKLDRLVLPIVFAAWVLAIAAGARFGPRVRWTPIHTATCAFLACAFLSVVFDARYLSSTLELDLPIKQLPLLLSYVMLFAIAATGIRRGEVRPFLIYTLVLGALTALGVIVEFRFNRNLFFEISGLVLPGVFDTPMADPSAVDGLGRRVIRGPADVPLEAVTMLSLALPIALVGIITSTRWRQRLLYGVAACLLVAAMFATYRKSALLAPVSVFLALAYFRRREFLRLAPLALILLVVVTSLSPGALGSTIAQFTRSDAGSVPTVSDRVADYDAIRPDLLSHLAFGRGWGSYSHFDFRILDSEILHRLIEGGVVGLLAYVLLVLSVVLSARRAIASRDPRVAPFALIGAAGAIAFLVASTLYDVMSFPHAAYIFLFLAGLTSVVVAQPRPAATVPAPPEPTSVADPVSADAPASDVLVPSR